MKATRLGALIAFVSGCAATGTTTPAKTTPAQTATDPYEVKGPLRTEPQQLMAWPEGPLSPFVAPPETGIPKSPVACAAYARVAVPVPCGDRPTSLKALSSALDLNGVARDASLGALDSCFAPGVVRALRADLVPGECADVVVADHAEHPVVGTSRAIHLALSGYFLAGRISRLPKPFPTMTPPTDKASVKAFIQGEVAAWMAEQVPAVVVHDNAGAKLSHWGRAVSALAAGLADARYVEAFRGAPVPDDLRKDAELLEAYKNGLEDAVAPLVTRGRDALLVSIGDMGQVGLISDPRLLLARRTLSAMYRGRKLDALSDLRLPPVSRASGPMEQTPNALLSAKLPTFFVGELLSLEEQKEPSVLAVLQTRGMPGPLRQALAQAGADEKQREALAQVRLRLFLTYLRAFDIEASVEQARTLPRTDTTKLILALGKGLRGGPKNAAEWMLTNTHAGLGFGDVSGLDALAEESSMMAFDAAFDAARILEVSPPEPATKAHYEDVAKRFARSESLAPDEVSRALARAGTDHARALGAAIQ